MVGLVPMGTRLSPRAPRKYLQRALRLDCLSNGLSATGGMAMKLNETHAGARHVEE
jgi:hypothetical protein